MTTRDARRHRRGHRIVTTLGELVAAIYAAMPGRGGFRIQQTAMVLVTLPRAAHLSRQIRVVG